MELLGKRIRSWDQDLSFWLGWLIAVGLSFSQIIAYQGASYIWMSSITIKNYLPRIFTFLVIAILVYLHFRQGIIKKLADKKYLWIIGIVISLGILIFLWFDLESTVLIHPLYHYPVLLLYFPPYFLSVMAFFLGIISLKGLFQNRTYYEVSILFYLFVFSVSAIAPLFNTSPFMTSFSEGSWIRSANVLSGFLKTGKAISWPILDPTRIFLVSITFIVNVKSLLGIRIFNLMIQILFYFLTAFLIVRRTKVKQPESIFFLTAGGFLILYFVDIPVNVLPGICLILWLFDSSKQTRSLLIIAIASIWEGLSRINWFVMPSLTGIILYTLETNLPRKGIIKYFSRLMIFALAGIPIAFFTYYLYTKFTQTPFLYFNDSFKYIYLPGRLLPNKQLITGTILGSLAITLHPILIFFKYLQKNRIQWIRSALFFFSLLATFFVAAVISMRIGGGYDFHNFDLYFFLCLIYLYYSLGDCVAIDEEQKYLISKSPTFLYGLVFGLLTLLLDWRLPTISLSIGQASNEIKQLQTFFDKNQNQSILFLTEQQLPLLNIVNVKNPDYSYDYVLLTEYLMAQNNSLVNDFIRDVEKGKFQFIVSPNLVVEQRRASDDPFAEENNIWVPVNKMFLPMIKPIIDSGGLIVYERIK